MQKIIQNIKKILKITKKPISFEVFADDLRKKLIIDPQGEKISKLGLKM